MLAHPTLDLLHALGLHGMAKGYQEIAANPEARSLEHTEWLGLLLEHEVTLRRQKPWAFMRMILSPSGSTAMAWMLSRLKSDEAHVRALVLDEQGVVADQMAPSPVDLDHLTSERGEVEPLARRRARTRRYPERARPRMPNSPTARWHSWRCPS